MEHTHKSTGLVFDCGTIPEFDITVITYWRQPDVDDLVPPILVSFYFGEYEADATDYYIDQWLKSVVDCKDIVDAYLLTNEDVLEEPWLSKALNAVSTFKEVERRFPIDLVRGDYNE